MQCERIICAGFGGQGIMTMGKLLAESGMEEEYEVSWLPSYGPEMRGGTANCQVVISDTPIGSPIISANADCVIAMNLPSVSKFLSELLPQGLLLYNSSLIREAPIRKGIAVIAIPANEIASEVGSLKVANMVMVGAYLRLREVLRFDTVLQMLPELLGSAKEQLLELDVKALEAGRQAAAEVLSEAR